MEKKEMINVDDFMSMYVAVSFLQEQRFFNLESIKNYLQTFYEIDENTIKQLDDIAKKMQEAKMIDKVPNYDCLYKISKKIPFKEIIYDKYEHLDGMINFFYSFNNCSIPNVKLMSEQNDNYDLLKK